MNWDPEVRNFLKHISIPNVQPTRFHDAGPAPDVLRVGLDLGFLVDGPARVLGVHAARGGEHEAAASVAVLALPNVDGIEQILWVLIIT